MKRLLLLAISFFAFTAYAQYDLSVTLIKPADGDYIPAGASWDVEYVVTNNGSTAITSTDTLAIFPSIGGQYVINPFAEFASIPVGGSATLTFVHPPLTGGVDGMVDFCVFAAVWNFADADSSDNFGCSSILWDTDATVGTEEFSVVELEDNSFYSKGVYNLDITNVYDRNNVVISVFNIAGQEVLTENLDVNNGVIKGSINMETLPMGIYLVNLNSKEGVISTTKVMVN